VNKLFSKDANLNKHQKLTELNVKFRKEVEPSDIAPKTIANHTLKFELRMKIKLP